MTTKPRIEFKRQRDIGEFFSDTFAFLRNEFKGFFTIVFKIVGPYVLVAITGLALYIYSLADLFNGSLMQSGGDAMNANPLYAIIGLLLTLIGGIAAYTLSYSSTLHYIKSYEDNNGVIKEEEIRQGVKRSFWSIIGLGIVNAIMISVGIMLCCIPGIYIWVPLTLSFSLLVFRDLSVTDSISDSFSLVNGEWWMTFITMFVIWLVIMIASYAFSIPSIIYLYVKMGITMGQGDLAEGSNFFTDPIYLGLTFLSYVFQYLLSLVTIVTSAMIYFHLNEKKNFTGAFEKIDSLGSN